MPRRGMGVEIAVLTAYKAGTYSHAPQGHGSRNSKNSKKGVEETRHAPQGHGSRNPSSFRISWQSSVMPRRGMGVEM